MNNKIDSFGQINFRAKLDISAIKSVGQALPDKNF